MVASSSDPFERIGVWLVWIFTRKRKPWHLGYGLFFFRHMSTCSKFYAFGELYPNGVPETGPTLGGSRVFMYSHFPELKGSCLQSRSSLNNSFLQHHQVADRCIFEPVAFTSESSSHWKTWTGRVPSSPPGPTIWGSEESALA